MQEKNTNELENILGKTHLSGYESYLKNNKDSIISESNSFYTYVRELLSSKHITQKYLFIRADISEGYGYKLLSGEKHTKQRDVILRVCYGAGFSLRETQIALKKYGMPELYAKDKRDVLIMIAFNERPGNIIDLNTMLKEHGLEPLRTNGAQN